MTVWVLFIYVQPCAKDSALKVTHRAQRVKENEDSQLDL